MKTHTNAMDLNLTGEQRGRNINSLNASLYRRQMENFRIRRIIFGICFSILGFIISIVLFLHLINSETLLEGLPIAIIIALLFVFSEDALSDALKEIQNGGTGRRYKK